MPGRNRYEMKIAGWQAFSPPVIALVGSAAFLGLMATSRSSTFRMAQVAAALLEVALPLASAISGASLTARDSAVELQLSLPEPYRVTLFRRIGPVLAISVLGALAGTAVLAAIGLWRPPHGAIVGQLAWLCPLAWLSALAVLVGVGLTGSATASALVGGIWLFFELIMSQVFQRQAWLRLTYLFATTRSPKAGYWLGNRLMLLVIATLLFGGAGLLLGRPERLLVDRR